MSNTTDTEFQGCAYPTLPVYTKKKPCVFYEGPYCNHYVCIHEEKIRLAKAEGKNPDTLIRPLTRTYRTTCLQGHPTCYCNHPMCLKARFRNGVPDNAGVCLIPIVYINGIPRIVQPKL